MNAYGRGCGSCGREPCAYKALGLIPSRQEGRKDGRKKEGNIFYTVLILVLEGPDS
jgi:hypothetical protein